ncbi:hypothetical protein B0T16DRAFT_450721 [Cercophora newfieldiana]|uniref:Uncharacterized protein n=1 Tax=Cercophora newfieldiana TaxID=92897 RepID=A0AA39YLV5_9PEZI|nr:hypothetical protein B0T16DRAFT_450721 [Cercophora newfieldiana]
MLVPQGYDKHGRANAGYEATVRHPGMTSPLPIRAQRTPPAPLEPPTAVIVSREPRRRQILSLQPADISNAALEAAREILKRWELLYPLICSAMTGGKLNFQQWWRSAKLLAWHYGSQHGFDFSTPNRLGHASSSCVFRFQDEFPHRTHITGAGPVWGCTILVVMNERGAYTTHWWQNPSFESGLAYFRRDVIDFLWRGGADGNTGLREHAQPSATSDLEKQVARSTHRHENFQARFLRLQAWATLDNLSLQNHLRPHT